jgi:hypothetical protein
MTKPELNIYFFGSLTSFSVFPFPENNILANKIRKHYDSFPDKDWKFIVRKSNDKVYYEFIQYKNVESSRGESLFGIVIEMQNSFVDPIRMNKLMFRTLEGLLLHGKFIKKQGAKIVYIHDTFEASRENLNNYVGILKNAIYKEFNSSEFGSIQNIPNQKIDDFSEDSFRYINEGYKQIISSFHNFGLITIWPAKVLKKGSLSTNRVTTTDVARVGTNQGVRERDETIKKMNDAIRERDEAIKKMNDAIRERDEAIKKMNDAVKGKIPKKQKIIPQKDLKIKNNKSEIPKNEYFIKKVEFEKHINLPNSKDLFLEELIKHIISKRKKVKTLYQNKAKSSSKEDFKKNVSQFISDNNNLDNILSNHDTDWEVLIYKDNESSEIKKTLKWTPFIKWGGGIIVLLLIVFGYIYSNNGKGISSLLDKVELEKNEIDGWIKTIGDKLKKTNSYNNQKELISNLRNIENEYSLFVDSINSKKIDPSKKIRTLSRLQKLPGDLKSLDEKVEKNRLWVDTGSDDYVIFKQKGEKKKLVVKSWNNLIDSIPKNVKIKSLEEFGLKCVIPYLIKSDLIINNELNDPQKLWNSIMDRNPDDIKILRDVIKERLNNLEVKKGSNGRFTISFFPKKFKEGVASQGIVIAYL